MKKLLLFFLSCLIFNFCFSQELTPEVISTAGEGYLGATAYLSWTVGEPLIESYTEGTPILTQGFQQPITTKATHTFFIKVFLQGPYCDYEMKTLLNKHGYLPLSQPYDSIHLGQNSPAWYYDGDESVDSIPNEDVVDWILVEIRDTNEVSHADESTIAARKAAFLLKDGRIVDLDGESPLQIKAIIMQHIFLVIWHRNHVGIMASTYVQDVNRVYTYDFTVPGHAFYSVQVDPGIVAMSACEGSGDNIVTAFDEIRCQYNWGISSYSPWDFNLDGCPLNQDVYLAKLKLLGIIQ